MALELEIKREANLEIIEAFLYYEGKRSGSGDIFLDHLDLYFKRIITGPKHFPKKRNPFKEAYIKRFPFLIVYEVKEDKIIVYSVFNTWQNPSKK